ncbi:MAG: ABC transporter permease [Ardenticatenaceae bacterium]|nr:ABC transporter permease [Ardenticatenaceae bacterium]
MERANRRTLATLALPATLWLVLFFALPLLLVLIISLMQRGRYGGVVAEFSLENYARLFNPTFLTIFINSLEMAVITTVLCLLFGYPLAYFIARARPGLRNALLLLVIIPFWTNFLVRTYAWMIILRQEGLLNIALQSLGLTNEPLNLLFTPAAVIIGLVYGYLPFMVLPLYATIEKFDFALVEAAHDLGATEGKAFRHIMLPQTMPGIVAGCILVFIPSLGAYITPDILGGAKVMMVGNLITQQFLRTRHWPFGSALSILLMAIVAIGILIYYRTGGEELL